ncbi:MAG: class I SAM-dependent methyltransferase [Calditrichaeota bacterium]|nr:MAG: class I SAM-dependent methyltransferase [Calditrichota bacterium]
MDRAALYDYADGSRFIGKSVREIFTAIAEENVWQEQETLSGIGSSLAQTAEIRRRLPELLQRAQIRTIFDVPCGDFNWFGEMDLSDIHYWGGDIVETLIRNNQQRYQAENVKFIHFNLLEDQFQVVDLIFCRDCLVHFSFNDIHRAVTQMINSDSIWLMTTTFPQEERNQDIPTGGWRPINLQKPPFNFPAPDVLLNENCTEMNGVFNDKSLGLWRISGLDCARPPSVAERNRGQF